MAGRFDSPLVFSAKAAGAGGPTRAVRQHILFIAFSFIMASAGAIGRPFWETLIMKLASSLAIAAALASSPVAPGAAFAAGSLKAAWVSGHGTNAAGCGSLTNPCATFQYVHDNIVAAGGLIAVLDSSSYGPLVIRNAISIVDDGGLAGIAVGSGDAIDIQAGPTDAIFLKGLHIDGLGTANNGINLTVAGSLTVKNCTIKGLGNSSGINGNGILIQPASGNLTFDISDTSSTGNGTYGIAIAPGWSNGLSSAQISGTVTRVDTARNGIGLDLYAGGNSAIKVVADQLTTSANIYAGIDVQNVSTLYLTRSVVTGNNYGFYGPINSYGDNAINGNANDTGGGTLIKAGLQ
jgi:hypothetical protein